MSLSASNSSVLHQRSHRNISAQMCSIETLGTRDSLMPPLESISSSFFEEKEK